MLKYSRELFEITQDETTARNIIALLFERNETNLEVYMPYLAVLENSESPDHCMAVALAMLRLGRGEAAEFYAYKALYLLNGKNDYDIFKNYFSFCNYNMHYYHSDEQIRSVRGNMVVILEESIPNSSPERMEFCLDSETEFSDEINRSSDIEHLTPSSPEYIKLQGSGLQQILKLRGKNYRIVKIIPRSQYCFGYIFRKIQENPEMFEGTVWTISTEDVNEMIEQIRSLTARTEQTESLLRSYHFEENEIGLLIDSVAFGDYGRYVGALKFLLYQPDQALYTGFPIYEDETGQRYVPTLSTLVLLSIIGKLDMLQVLKADLIIPESYRVFFREQYAKAVDKVQTSTSTLSISNDQLTIQDADRSIPEVWEATLEFCEDCEVLSITDEERINFRFADDLTGERIISGFGLSPIHLDSLILAARENATYLCDDLFFRKLASWAKIRNLNFVSLLEHYTDGDYTVPIIIELSKTNYLYIPFLARDDEDTKEIYQNVLVGEKKQRYYGEILSNYFEVRRRIIKELFGDEYALQ